MCKLVYSSLILFHTVRYPIFTHDTCRRQRNEPLLPSTVLPGRPGDNPPEKGYNDRTSTMAHSRRYMGTGVTETPHDTSAGQQDGTHFRKRPAVTVRPTRSPTGSRGTRSESRKRSGTSLPPEENLCFPYCIRRRRNAIRNSGSRAGELPGNYYMRKERPPVKLTSSRAGFQLTEAKIPNSSPASPSKRQLRPALKWTSCT